MNKLTQFTTTQLIKELIQRKLIEITVRGVNITEEFMKELKNADFDKYLNPKCRECGSFLFSGNLCYECSQKLRQENV